MEENKTTRKDKKWWKITKIALCITFFLTLLFCYSHFITPHTLETKETKIVNDKITNTFHGFKIVQISDIHYGSTTNEKDLLKIQKEINLLKPDIVVFTGDLFEHNKITEKEQKIVTDFLSGIEANIEKYAITGEDDYGLSNYSILLENGGFQLLDEKYDLLYNKQYESIFIAGMSTNTTGTKNAKDKMIPVMNYLNESEVKPNYTILITHEPDSILEIDYSKFDLILAGHSHLGQIRIPFIGGLCYPSLSKSFKESHYILENTELYISGGIGTTKTPFRLFNAPQINLYRLTNH